MAKAGRDGLVAAWYTALCALVIAMILVGGATRLTDSGLSITEWNFEKQVIPPLSQDDWNEEFDLYRQTVEYQRQNQGMSLADFQFIYWWEWGHRFLGKVVGLVWALGLFGLFAMGRLKGRVGQAFGMGVLGGIQGAIGWWMVTSGLWSGLDVSPLRLAVHLGVAFVILFLGVRLTLAALDWPARLKGQGSIAPGLRWGFVALLFGQIFMGAITAGSDAGRAYGDWPTIRGEWVPAGYSILTLTDLASIQFTHRTLGYLVVIAAGLLWWTSRSGAGAAKRLAAAMFHLSLVQMLLGIATIWLGAPLWISLIHQFGAVLLWMATAAWMHASGVRYDDTAPQAHGAQAVSRGA